MVKLAAAVLNVFDNVYTVTVYTCTVYLLL